MAEGELKEKAIEEDICRINGRNAHEGIKRHICENLPKVLKVYKEKSWSEIESEIEREKIGIIISSSLERYYCPIKKLVSQKNIKRIKY
jgi:hypothetical protein